MRTRRSPRNQERLWRELGGHPRGTITVDEVESLERSLAQPFLSQRTQRQLIRDLTAAKRRRAFAAARTARAENVWSTAT